MTEFMTAPPKGTHGARPGSGRRQPGGFVAGPEAGQAPEVGDELLVLVRRVGSGDRIDDQPVEFRPGGPVEYPVVDIGQLLRAELLILCHREIGVGQLQVPGELLPVVEAVAVADLEVRAGMQIGPGPARTSRSATATTST